MKYIKLFVLLLIPRLRKEYLQFFLHELVIHHHHHHYSSPLPNREDHRFIWKNSTVQYNYISLWLIYTLIYEIIMNVKSSSREFGFF